MKGLNLLLIVVLLGMYCFGASVMDSFVIYNGWRFVGEAEFAKLHQEDGTRIVALFVLPMLIYTVLTVLLLWFRPTGISKKLVWIALSCQIIAWLSSAFIQIPMQFQLDKGKDAALLEQLIVSDWIRVIAGIVLTGVIIKMLFQAVKKALT